MNINKLIIINFMQNSPIYPHRQLITLNFVYMATTILVVF